MASRTGLPTEQLPEPGFFENPRITVRLLPRSQVTGLQNRITNRATYRTWFCWKSSERLTQSGDRPPKLDHLPSDLQNPVFWKPRIAVRGSKLAKSSEFYPNQVNWCSHHNITLIAFLGLPPVPILSTTIPVDIYFRDIINVPITSFSPCFCHHSHPNQHPINVSHGWSTCATASADVALIIPNDEHLFLLIFHSFLPFLLVDNTFACVYSDYKHIFSLFHFYD